MENGIKMELAFKGLRSQCAQGAMSIVLYCTERPEGVATGLCSMNRGGLRPKDYKAQVL